jgi:hypothetical protein
MHQVMANRSKSRTPRQKGDYLSRYGSPLRSEPLEIPGFTGARPVLSLVLKVLAGKDRKTLRDHLKVFLDLDFPFRGAEVDTVLKVLDYSPEFLDSSVDAMITTMRELSDMWIDSGKSSSDPDVDNPSDRSVEKVLPGRLTSLFRIINAGLFDHFPRHMGMRSDGTQGPTSGWPHFDIRAVADLIEELKTARQALGYTPPGEGIFDGGLLFAVRTQLETFGRQWAMYWFAELLNSPYPRHLSRCDHCKRYFASERQRSLVKCGVYCPGTACKSKASVARTERFRERSRSGWFDTAAQKWIKSESLPQKRRESQLEWEHRRREWVAVQVNQVHNTDFRKRWVSQNLKQIQERVEALRNAKG